MIKYLEQLAELYWYKFSALLIFAFVLLFIVLLLFARSAMGALSPSAQAK